MPRLFRKIILLVLIFTFQLLPQSFGFGCLGFVGGFGGFTYQQYNPDGLNTYVANFNSTYSEYIDNSMSDFGKATGYRVGINVFRAKFKGLFVTAKGYYQQLVEDHSALVYQTAVGIDYEYDLKIKSWGVGADIGIPVTDYLSWKILDGSILVNSARFTETINSSQGTSVKKYDNDKTEIGYSIGTGFIFEIVKDYISLEGAASYSQLTIDKMKADDGSGYLDFNDETGTTDKFINSGGFNAILQLNIGFPL
jgi:hypothetical protein